MDYLGIAAIAFGFDILEDVGIDAVHDSVAALTQRFLAGLAPLQQADGGTTVQLLGPSSGERRGATVARNFHRADGSVIDHREIERRAGAERVSLRTGCFCNPGASEAALHLTNSDIDRCFPTAIAGGLAPFRWCLSEHDGTGAVRISFGIASNEADVDRVLEFMRAVVAT